MGTIPCLPHIYFSAYPLIEFSGMKVRSHLYIKGRVQGVGYRAFVVRTAGVFNLGGWVRNLPDRSVEAVFEGDRPSIEAALKRLQEGPPAAMVSSIDINWTDQPEGFTRFDVRF
jgi:acylphosphatase